MLQNNILPYNLICDVDSYKVDHVNELPVDTEFYYSTVIARKANEFTDHVVVMGLQPVIQMYLSTRITADMVEEAAEEIKNSGYQFRKDLWDIIVNEMEGKLPLEIRAVPEGTIVPVGTVIVTVVNTDKRFAWLASYIETILQRAMWKMTTVATICSAIRRDLLACAETTGTDAGHVLYALHNFGDRGADAHEVAVMAGIAHLSQFEGTDCLQANRYIKRLYGSDRHHGTSVVASEHSVMCGLADPVARDDYAAAVRMLDRLDEILTAIENGATNLAPIVSIVIDTYNAYRFADEYIGIRLKGVIDRLGARGGKVVLRPDSGNAVEMPIEIIKLLMKNFGYTTNAAGFKQLPAHVGVIQGDGLNQKSLRKILRRLEEEKLALGNIVFGMGGGLTHEAGRDEFSFAMKATARCDSKGIWHDLFKDPITDIGKRSLRGRVTTYKCADGRIFSERLELQEVNKQIVDMLTTVFLNGELVTRYTFPEVLSRARV